MLDQVEAFFSLLDRFKRFCGAQSKPPVPETLAGRFFRLFEAHGEGLMKHPYAQPGAREKFEMALDAQRSV